MPTVDGRTVLEVGEYVAIPYAGKLFSDLGADVIKLEPPEGDVARRVGPYPDDDPDPDASEFFGYLNTGKRSVTLPHDDGIAPAVVDDLIDAHEVDLVLESDLAAFGVDPEALSAAHPRTSVVAVSGFGATGPWQDRDAPDLVGWAESGHMNKMGYPDSTPMRPRIKAADYWAAQVATIAAMGALFRRDLQGEDGGFVDVAKRDAGTSAMEHFITGYSWSGATTQRSGAGYPSQGSENASRTIYETADGYISAAPGGKWEVFCEEFLERPELIEDERFATRPARRENLEAVTEIVEEYTRQYEKWDLLERFQDAGIASGVTSTPEDLAIFDHLDERDFWQEVPLADGTAVTMPGFPLRVDSSVVEMSRAPRLGEHTAEVLAPLDYDVERLASTGRATGGDDRARRGPRVRSSRSSRDEAAEDSVSGAGGDGSTDGRLPLSGVRVLDFTWVYAGPHASKMLAALGADVVKVESERKPDSVRNLFTYGFEPGETASTSAYYNEHNQGKRSLTLDLTNDRGREIALDLMAEADVVMENYSPNFLPSIDLGYETIREVNPEVVYLSMPGMAKTGPAKHFRAYGLTLQSMAGLDHVSGWPDDPPTTAGHSWPDPTGGYMGAIGALMGLYRREQVGESVFVELPQFEATVSLLHKPVMEYLVNGREPERLGVRDEDDRYVQGVYPCAGEDRWAVVAVETDAQWERLARVIGRPDLVDDDRFASQYDRLSNHDAVDEAIASWTRERSREEVRERLQDHEVPAGIVADERDLVEYDPQLRAREYFTIHDHPEVGEQSYQGPPFRMADCEIAYRTRSPLFGEHTDEVLSEWLGMRTGDIEAARTANALF